MTTRYYDTTAKRWRIADVYLPNNSVLDLQRTNECINPQPITTTGWQGLSAAALAYAPWDVAKRAFSQAGNGVSTAYTFTAPSSRASWATGTTVTVSATMQAPAGTLYRPYVHSTASGNTYFGGTGAATLAATGAPQRISVSWTFASDWNFTIDMAVLFYNSSGGVLANGVTTYVGDVLIEEGATAGAYFDGWSGNARTNLVNASGMIDLGTITRVNGVSYAGKTWSRITPGVNAHGLRSYADLTSLVDGYPYTASYEVANDGVSSVTCQVDWCDSFTSGTITVAPGEVKRIYAGGPLADYTSTFRFVDLSINVAGTTLLVGRPMIELGSAKREYIATTGPALDGLSYSWAGTSGASKSTVSRPRWEVQRRSPLPGMVFESMFAPYIGQGTVWTRDITSMPLDPQSATMASYMWTESPTRYNSVTGNPSGAFGAKTSLNTSAQNTQPIACCIVDSTEPGCRFQYMDTVSGPGMTTAEADALLKGPIPWPTGFNPALNGDRGMAIYDKGTGIMREYFMVLPVTGKPGHWTATTGGYSIANPHFVDLATTNYPTQYKGSNAVVRMHNSLGFIGISEVRNRKINHALAFTMANAIGGVTASWPGIASDGKFPPATWSGWAENGGANGPYPGPSPRHGQWGRLPTGINLEYNPRTGLPYKPLTQLLITAAQTYGLVGTDTNAFVNAFNTESGNREKAIFGADPWAASGELATLLDPGNPSGGLGVDDFPWDLTQWAPVDWGRPNPDFRLRDGEVFAYEPHTR